MKANKLYCCYSVPLKKFLEDNGLKAEIKAKNCNTNCTFWVFIKTEKLDKCLKEWSLGGKN